MNIFITGGTGLIGSSLVKLLISNGHTVTVLTRNPDKAKQALDVVVEYCPSLNNLSSLDGFDAVINLAGEPIGDKRWSQKQKDLLCKSRWITTQKLSSLIKAGQNPPKVFISGSAVGYYGSQGENLITENSGYKEEFTHYLCNEWEKYAREAESPATRVCLLRTGIVLSAKGGALAKMLPVFRLGIGGVMGNGKQYLPWIHIDDMVNAIYHLLITANATGAFNMVAPNPVSNTIFSKTLAKVLHRPCLMPIPAFAIRLLMGEAATLVLDGQRAIPEKLIDLDYKFRFELIDDALRDVLK